MKLQRVYLSGQIAFDNRGCEAIVRSTVGVLRNAYPGIEILVPSDDIARDERQWPTAADHGVHFVPAYVPWFGRYWVHLQRLPFAFLKRAAWPFAFPEFLKTQISSVDAVIAIGGDNYSLDYRLPSLIMAIDYLAMQLDKPVFLWGASVGPFEKEPDFVPAITQHLKAMKCIMVRESVSYQYLTQTLGLGNVQQMVDPAFTLTPETIETTEFMPDGSNAGVVGLNVSPLIERYRRADQDLLGEVVSFIRWLVREQGYGVLLVPHVVPLVGASDNDDAIYMRRIIEAAPDLAGCLKMMPADLNAAQIKNVISRVRFFIGARTHATIAALSSGLPTISIAYSIKARGINRDLFDDEAVVLPTPELSDAALQKKFLYLVTHEEMLRERLREALPRYRQQVEQAAGALGDD
ncbi:polysaccharide pyruvyl transferase family protein [Pseudomonas sp. B11D7D]|nr:polysaccharide pyruvyl transferase family protein [Pseudomonas sp. B11D7D]QNH04850.1 polysaccharide pyruvyl transferase family protein [Pseudomonas sp. B11D7D]